MKKRGGNARTNLRSNDDRKLYDLLDRLKIGVAEISSDGKWLSTNRYVSKILGFSPRALLNKPVRDLLQPDEATENNAVSKSFGLHRNGWLNTTWCKKDGSTVSASALLVSRSFPGRSRLFLIANSTHPNKIQEKLQRSERDRSLILDAFDDGYWDLDCRTGEFHYGPGWITSLGYSMGDLPKDMSFWESVIHPDDFPMFEAELLKSIEGKASELCFGCRLRAKTGHFKWFRTRGKVVERDANKRAVRIIGTVSNIDEAYVANEELAKSKAELEAILESTSNFVWSVDCNDFGLMTCNRPFELHMEQHHGIKLHPGMTPDDLGSVESAAQWNAFYRQALKEGGFSLDYKLLNKNEYRHLSFQRMERDGRVFGISVIAQDITDRKRMEDDLRKSEEKFSKAFKQSPVAMTLTSLRDRRYIDVNETFEQITGHRRDEIIGKTPFDLRIWVDPKVRLEAERELQEKGTLREFEFQFRTKSGEIREALGTGELIEIDGEPCMLAVSSDVTDRNRAVEALRDSEERLRLAVASGRMYAFEWDLSTDIVKRSAESSAILGIPDAGGPQPRQNVIDKIHQDEREQFLRTIESLSSETPSYRITYRYLRPDGKTIWLEESGRKFFDLSGNPQRIVGMVADVSEARRSEYALRELSGRLINSQEEERRRIARELHDNIGQELALLAVQAQRVDSGIAEAEHTAQSDVHELYKKIKDLATKVSKLSHRLHSSELEFLGLGIAVERLCRDIAKQFNVDVDYEIKNIPQTLDGNISVCLYRVVQEGLQNVVKHSAANKVVLCLSGRRHELELKIQDNGKGFDADTAPLGSGLGLVSMRERIRLVGGQLVIHSKLGQGTTLEASVPTNAQQTAKTGF